MAAGGVVWGTLMSTRVPPELRGRVHSLDWLVSIGLTPVSFALTAPVSKAIGIDATLVLAAIVPALAMVVLYVVAGLQRDEARHPDAASSDAAVVTP
jgi:DHA3 family tetracycline resistance protein-like MFS transporter